MLDMVRYRTICAVATSTETEAAFGDSVYRTAAEAATLLSTAADPNRMAILSILAGGTSCVCTLQAQIPVAPSLLSYHLKVLRDAGLISGRRRGRWVDYELVGDALERLRDAIPRRGCEPMDGPVWKPPATACCAGRTRTTDPARQT